MTWGRAISILVGIAVSLALHNIAGFGYWTGFAVGLVVMFLIQAVLGSVERSRRFQRQLDRLADDAKDGRPLIDDDGNRIL